MRTTPIKGTVLSLALAVAGFPLADAVEARQVVVAFGDSITLGADVFDEQGRGGYLCGQ